MTALDTRQFLLTPRLRLTPIRREDLPLLVPIQGDAELMSLILVGGRSPKQIAEWIEMSLVHWETHRTGAYMLWDRQTSEPVGYVGLKWMPQESALEVGYCLHRATRGQGFATEASRALLQHAFEVLGQTRVLATIATGHGPSERVAERLGMTPLGRGHYDGFECRLFGITREAWAAGQRNA